MDDASAERAVPMVDPGSLTQPRLLAELAAGATVSGSALAARFGISRTAVWKLIGQLRSHGLAVAAQAGGGYRLDAPLDLLDARHIRRDMGAAMRDRLGGLDVHWQIDSTSSELLRRAAGGAPDRSACAAEIQTHGRGRRGRAWRMPLGAGVALSLLKRFEGGMASLAGLSLVAGIAVVQALGDCGVAEVGLKWPNDLLARGRKLGGVLVELGGDALGACHAVIGIGINVRLPAAVAIDQPWIDLAALAPAGPPSRNRIAAGLLERLADALDRFECHGFAPFAPEYAAHDALRGKAVDVLRADGAQHGVALGVDARGALRVRFAAGERSVDSGEVSVRSAR